MKNRLEKPRYDVTRYLCAAAELDRKFRSAVFEQVVHNPYRFVARCYGVDLPRVVRQCLRAQARDIVVDLLLSAILLVFIINHFYEYGLFYGLIYFLPKYIALPLILFFLVIYANKLYSYHAVARNLSYSYFHKQEEKKTYIESLYKDRLAELAELEDGNTIYYSGYSPFVGAGERIGGWSFVFSTKGQEGRDQFVELSLPEMYAFMEERIDRLKIDGMSINHGLFVDGKTLRNQPEFLPNESASPLPNVTEDVIHTSMGTFSEQNRYYKVVQVSGWQGNFVFSTFFRFTKNNRQMFVEVNYYVLGPLQANYYAIDRLKSGFTGQILGSSILKSIIPAIISPFYSPFRLVSRFSQLIAKQNGIKQELQEIKDNPMFDYGAERSIREMVATEQLQNYFQEADIDMYRKQIERHLMDGVTAFLETQDVDVSEFNMRKETIIQQGITINGGNFQVENLVNGNQEHNSFFHNVKELVKVP